MAKGIRLRAPGLIRLGSGLTYGSGAYFGQTASDLTSVLRQMQAAESTHALATGKPEEFLAFYSANKGHYSGTLRAQLDGYAEQATKKIETDKKDAAALASYARTNNHQKYLDYLLSKLDETTDPAQLSALSTQINTMRGRVFQSSGAASGVGGGVSADDLTTDRQAWIDAKSDVDSAKGPLTDDQVKALSDADVQLAKDLRAIADDGNVKQSVRKAAQQEMVSRGLGDGTKTGKAVANANAQSDASVLKSFKSDDDFTTSLALNKTDGDRAVAWAKRAVDAQLAVKSMKTPDGASNATKVLQNAEKEAVASAGKAATGSTQRPPEDQRLIDSMFRTYEQNVELQQAKNRAAGQNPGPGPQSKDRFIDELKVASDPKQFAVAMHTSLPFSQQDFVDGKKAAGAENTATYDVSTGRFTGNANAASEANKSIDAVHILYGVKGGPLAEWNDKGMTSDSEIIGILTGKFSTVGMGERQAASTASGENVARHAQQERTDMGMGTGATPTAPAPTAGTETAPAAPAPTDQGTGAPAAVAEQAPTSAGTGIAPENAGPKPGLAAMTPDNVTEHMDEASQMADQYLNEYQLPELPNVKVESPDVNMESLFPFTSDRSTQPVAGGGGAGGGGRY